MAAREAAADATTTEKTSASTRSATATVDEETAAPAPRTSTRKSTKSTSSGGGRKKTGGGAPPAGDGLRRLVIVESPAKARKIADYLGSSYIVESSRGHIRDLPRGAADVPAKYKGESWARLGVDVDHEFEPLYIVTPDKKSTVTELKDALKEVDELYLATDGDREGEAIAWHLLETLKPKVPVRRMVFHEITESAIQAAAANPRELDQDLVDAQETRRILDRLYGYEVSPVLWKQGHVGALRGPRAVRGDPASMVEQASASGWQVPRRRRTGTSRAILNDEQGQRAPSSGCSPFKARAPSTIDPGRPRQRLRAATASWLRQAQIRSDSKRNVVHLRQDASPRGSPTRCTSTDFDDLARSSRQALHPQALRAVP